MSKVSSFYDKDHWADIGKTGFRYEFEDKIIIIDIPPTDLEFEA